MAPLLLTIVIHETKMQKLLPFEPKMTALEASTEVRNKLQDTLLKGLGKAEEYGLFQPNKEDPKKGVWLDPQKSLSYYMLEMRDALEYRKRIRIMRIRMLDNSVKALLVDDAHSVEQLMVPICQSIGITNHYEYSLVWENRPKEVIEKEGTLAKLKLREYNAGDKVKDAKMQELAAKMNLDDTGDWVDNGKTLREQGIVESEVLLLKRKLFFKEDEETDNPLQRNMLYEQAKQDIIKGKQPVTEDQAVDFAALQVQVQFGDFKENIHRPGFLSKNLSEFVEQSYVRHGAKIEKKILLLHKNKHKGASEGDAKAAYIKLAQNLETFGTTFFLVKEQVKGKNKLEPRLLGVTKDGVLRLDERTKEIMQRWPLEQVKRWAATQNIFTIDFGDYSQGFYSVQTPDGDKISEMVSGYIDLMNKAKENGGMIDSGTTQEIMDQDTSQGKKGAVTLEHGKMAGGKLPTPLMLNPSQKALMTTIQNGKKAISDSIANVQTPAELSGDLSSDKWKDSQMNSSKQNIVSNVSAMNAATAQMVLLSGYGEDADHDAIGAAVTTITYNMPELVGAVQNINALMDDDGVSSRDLMDATKALCDGFADLFAAAEPNNSREGMFSAAREVGNRSRRVLYTIQEEDLADGHNQNILNDLVKVVASAVAKMMDNAKVLAEGCNDEDAHKKIIDASTNCAMVASQLVACTQVVAPTINDPVCQEQLIEAAKEVARSVEGCIYACRDGCDPTTSLTDLSKSASDVSKALNDVISHVKGGHEDYLPEIMERIVLASDQIFASNDSGEQVQQSRVIAQSTSDLIQALKYEIDATSDSDMKEHLNSLMKEIIKATADMIEAAKVCADDPSDVNKQKELELSTESLLNICQTAVNTIRKPTIFKKLAQICKTSCGTATQCIAAAKGAEKSNTNGDAQGQLMESCKHTADFIPRIIEAVRLMKLNPAMAMAQLNLINTADQFVEPAESMTQSIRSTLPFVKNQTASLPLSNACKQMESNLEELKFYIEQANQVSGALEVEATKDIIESLQNELEDLSRSVKRGSLKPSKGANSKESLAQFKEACRSVGSSVKLLLDKASEGDEHGSSDAIRDTVNGLKDFNDAVRGILSTAEGIQNQGKILDASRSVLSASGVLVGDAQKVIENPLDGQKQQNLQGSGKSVIDALNNTLACLPGHKEVAKVMSDIDKWSKQLDSGNFKSSGRPYNEVTVQLRKAANKFNDETSNVVHNASDTDKFADSTRRFGLVLGEVMEHSTDIISQTTEPEARRSMIKSLKEVASNSTNLMSSAKTVSINPLDSVAKEGLTQSAREISDNLNTLITTCTSASPSQGECDNAIRNMQSSKHTLNNATEPVSKSSYYQCLDIIKKQSKSMGEGMGKLGGTVKTADQKAFADALKDVTNAVNTLIGASAQSAYLVSAGDPSSKPGVTGYSDMADVHKSVEALKDVCSKVCSTTEKLPENVMTKSYPMIVSRHGSILVDLCKHSAVTTAKPANKEELLAIGQGIGNACAKLEKELETPPHLKIQNVAKDVLDALDKFMKHFNSQKVVTQPAKIGEEGLDAAKDIVKYGGEIVDRSSSMITSVKSLVVNPKDPPTWQTLANTSKEVSDSIKHLIAEIENKAPGQTECEEAMETLTMSSRELNNASLAAQHKNLERRQDKNIQQFTEQIEIAAGQIKDRLPALKLASKIQAEKLGHSVTSLISYFEPLSTNSINFAKNMVSSKQQIMLLDKTKASIWAATDLLNSTKACGGNYKRTDLHQDIDEQSKVLEDALQELLDLVEKLSPNMGVMSNVVHSITEAVHVVDNYKPSGKRESTEDLVTVQTEMMSLTKEIARKSQDIVVQSTNNPEVMGELTLEISNDYQALAKDAKTASGSISNPDIGKQLRMATSDLGSALTELVKSTGACQSSPKDANLLRDVSENARHVTEKCTYVQAALNAANAGTHALENAANSTLGVIADLNTMMIFASAGTLENDDESETFADHKQTILDVSSTLVQDTKKLALGSTGKQDMADVADGSYQTIVKLSEAVKKGAGSLTSNNSEAQVMLLTSVKDVATALHDLLQSRKGVSTKKKDDENINKSAQVMARNISSLIKTVKTIEDENSRGTRALETAIEAIGHDLETFNSKDVPQNKVSAEELIKVTRPLTIATGKAVSAGNSLKQDDIVAAANTGRQAISDLLITCKAAAFASEKLDARAETLQAGNDIAVEYQELFKLIEENINHEDSSNKEKLNGVAQQIAISVTALAKKAQNLKDGDWVDPSDPTFIAENELNNAAKSIEAAAAKLALLKPRREFKAKDGNQDLTFDEAILEAAKSIAAASSALIRAASAAQKELVQQGKIQQASKSRTEDGQWSEGLVSAAKMVAAATNALCDAANTLVKGISSEEKLIAAAQQVASSTAQLVLACKVKADRGSEKMRGLESASRSVRKATDTLIKGAKDAKDAADKEAEEASIHSEASDSVVGRLKRKIQLEEEAQKAERAVEEIRNRMRRFQETNYKH